MDSILDGIAKATKVRIEKSKKMLPFGDLKKKLQEISSMHSREAFAFEKALKKPGISFICEVKKASPSKGVIDPVFPYIQIAREYEAAGADAVSVLTEPDFFEGNNTHLYEIRNHISLPILRKDFILDEYQIYKSKYLGADALLLICTLLSEEKLTSYISLCDELGLSALVEAHTEEEVKMAIRAGARILGVNNRNLKTFQVDVNHSLQFRRLVPKEICFVSESGIQSHEDILHLRNGGVDAVLIGESLMRSQNKKEMLMTLKGENL